MKISDSCRLYLENYYVLEQTRTETNQYLEHILVRAIDLADEHIKNSGFDELLYRKYVQKYGGFSELIFEKDEEKKDFAEFEKIKYCITYQDAMRSDELSSATNCFIFGFTPKNEAVFSRSMQRTASDLGLMDPYERMEIDLIDELSEITINKLKDIFIEYFNNFVKIIEAMKEDDESE